MRKCLLIVLLMIWPVEISAQDIRRPPVVNTCSECPPLDSFWCQMYPAPCEQCLATCGEQAGDPPRQVKPAGPPYDPWLGNYNLPKTIAVTQVYHEDVPWNVEPLRHMSNLDLSREVWLHGFRALKVWIQENPVNCTGDWTWHTPWGVEMFTPGSEEYGCYGEDMGRFWRESYQDVLIIRPQWYGWSGDETSPDGARLTYMSGDDFYAIAKRLYREVGYRDMVVILTDWEQDWIYAEYPEWTLEQIERRQEQVERARKEAFIELGHRPKLRVMHSVVVNKYPQNSAEVGTTLAEQIPFLKHRPDLVGMSYWSRGVDPIEALTWLKETTKYPPRRIYIDELGADEQDQGQRFEDYIPVFRDWGIKLICVWMWKQTWCDPAHQRGLWKQAQPCIGKPVFTDPTNGYYKLLELNNGGN